MSSSTLQLSPALNAYLVDVGVHEPALATKLRGETAAMPMARMQISPEQGQLLAWLVGALGVRRAIEVGTFTGYSALRVALAMPHDGELLCCDVSDEYTSVARRYWTEAGLDDRIKLVLAPATETLNKLLTDGQAATWDFAFVDADKPGYATYVEQLHSLLRVGGVIALDNVLWSGKVLDATDTTESTVALRDLNEQLKHDERWDRVMLPIGDGLTLLRKR
jgi:predicted O-methyltransferase YrrM